MYVELQFYEIRVKTIKILIFYFPSMQPSSANSFYFKIYLIIYFFAVKDGKLRVHHCL